MISKLCGLSIDSIYVISLIKKRERESAMDKCMSISLLDLSLTVLPKRSFLTITSVTSLQDIDDSPKGEGAIPQHPAPLCGRLS